MQDAVAVHDWLAIGISAFAALSSMVAVGFSIYTWRQQRPYVDRLQEIEEARERDRVADREAIVKQAEAAAQRAVFDVYSEPVGKGTAHLCLENVGEATAREVQIAGSAHAQWLVDKGTPVLDMLRPGEAWKLMVATFKGMERPDRITVSWRDEREGLQHENFRFPDF